MSRKSEELRIDYQLSLSPARALGADDDILRSTKALKQGIQPREQDHEGGESMSAAKLLECAVDSVVDVTIGEQAEVAIIRRDVRARGVDENGLRWRYRTSSKK